MFKCIGDFFLLRAPIIGEWQERAVRLDRNQRQNRIEERTLERNAVCL